MFKFTKKGIMINNEVRVNYGAFAVLAVEAAVVISDCKKNGAKGILTGLAKCTAAEVAINAPAVICCLSGNEDCTYMKGWNKVANLIGTEVILNKED